MTADHPAPGQGSGVIVEEDVAMTVRDGIVLRADVYRGPGEGPKPVLLCRTPYDKSHPRYVWIAEALAGAGYLAVVQDTRGRYRSEGDWAWHLTDEGHRQEAEDGYDTCEWAATLPGADGQVGTWGNSYPSGCAWWMASAQPPSLKAVFASGFPVSHREATGGIFETGLRLAWQHRMAVSTRRRSGDDRWPRTVAEAVDNWAIDRNKWVWHVPLDDMPDHYFGPTAPAMRAYMHDIASEHWGLDRVHPRVAVPTCSLTGWWDRLSSCADHFTGMRERGPDDQRDQHRLVIGPWVHDVEGEPNWRDPRGRGTDADEGHLAHMLRWYDHHLRGLDVGLDDEPPVKVFVLNEGWRTFDAWPPTGVVGQSWYLHGGGSARTAAGDGRLDRLPPGDEPPDTYTYDPADPVMTLYEGQLVAHDQAPLDDRTDLLVYRSEPLTEAMCIVGHVVARIWFASDQPDTDLFVRLVEEVEDGPAINLAQGVLRARYRDGFDREVMLEPGKPVEMVVRLLASGIKFLVGSRIRVDITSSDFPGFDRNHNTGRPYHSDPELRVAHQVVLHDADHQSMVVLPVLPDSSTAVMP